MIKQLLKKLITLLKRYRQYILIFIIPFIIVNMFDYSDSKTIVIKISNILNIFSSLTINNLGLNLYISIITIISLLIVLIQWQQNERSQRQADINGLIEEIKHNINTIGNIYCDMNYKCMHKDMYNMIKKLNDNSIYPNPSDSSLKSFELHKYAKYNTDKNSTLMKLRSSFIDSIISSRVLFNIKPKRIFLNIGHLKYSLDRFNLQIERNNNLVKDGLALTYFPGLREEYFTWLHYRIHFLLVDIITSVDRQDIIDIEYYDKVYKEINE